MSNNRLIINWFKCSGAFFGALAMFVLVGLMLYFWQVGDHADPAPAAPTPDTMASGAYQFPLNEAVQAYLGIINPSLPLPRVIAGDYFEGVTGVYVWQLVQYESGVPYLIICFESSCAEGYRLFDPPAGYSEPVRIDATSTPYYTPTYIDYGDCEQANSGCIVPFVATPAP